MTRFCLTAVKSEKQEMKIVRFDIYHKTLTLLSFLGIDLCGPVLVHVELDGGGQDEGDEDKDDDDGDDPLQDGGDLVLGQLGDGDKVRGENTRLSVPPRRVLGS